jgi:hypothetical protein
MKGVIHPDHIPRNKYQLLVDGMPDFTFLTVGNLEEELETVDLPDRTTASGGNTKPIEFTAAIPTHHTEERDAMEAWYQEGQDPVDPGYKKTAILVKQSISEFQTVAYTLIGTYPCKRNTSELEMANEGELDQIEWTFKSDQIIAR